MFKVLIVIFYLQLLEHACKFFLLLNKSSLYFNPMIPNQGRILSQGGISWVQERYVHYIVKLPFTIHCKFCTFLTHWLPVYEYIVLGNRAKPGIFQLTQQLHSSVTHCARVLFKPSKDLASLQLKMFFVLDWHQSGLCLLPIVFK